MRSTLLHFSSQWGPKGKIQGSEFLRVIAQVFLNFKEIPFQKGSAPEFIISVLDETCPGTRLNFKVSFEPVSSKSKMLILGLPQIQDFLNFRCSPVPAGIVFGHFGAQLRKANKCCEALSSISPPSRTQRAKYQVLSFRVSPGRYF